MAKSIQFGFMLLLTLAIVGGFFAYLNISSNTSWVPNIGIKGGTKGLLKVHHSMVKKVKYGFVHLNSFACSALPCG